MILCVDAYNVIKHLLPHKGDTPEAQRQWLLAQMADYLRVKKNELTSVIVVFDGGLFSRRMREVYRGVVVLFAGHERSADDVLIEYARTHRERALIVSNDRELQRLCGEHGAQGLKVDEFWQLRGAAVRDASGSSLAHTFDQVDITKFEDQGDQQMAELDELMVAGSVGMPVGCDQEEEERVAAPGRKLSKAARARARIHKKLG